MLEAVSMEFSFYKQEAGDTEGALYLGARGNRVLLGFIRTRRRTLERERWVQEYVELLHESTGGHTGQDRDKKRTRRRGRVSWSSPLCVFPKLLQYLQEANELFCDIPNPFFLPIYTIVPIATAKLIWLQLTSILRRLKGNGLAVPQASHFTCSMKFHLPHEHAPCCLKSY